MTRNEFESRMKYVKTWISTDPTGCFVCILLDKYVAYRAELLFQRLFMPPNLFGIVYFNKDERGRQQSNEWQKAHRIMAITLFEQICLDSKAYQKWK